jgi:hypothetical protein
MASVASVASEASEASDTISSGKILREINLVKNFIESHKTELPNNIYLAFDGISQTILAYRDSDKQSGWAKTILLPTGKRMWTDDQASNLESILPKLIDPLFKSPNNQTGGGTEPTIVGAATKAAVSSVGVVGPVVSGVVDSIHFPRPPEAGAPTLHLTGESDYIKGPDAATFSMDAIFEGVRNWLKSIDEGNRQLASIVGPLAVIKGVSGDPVLIPAISQLGMKNPITISKSFIIPAINSVLETCRILVSNKVMNIGYLRKILSIVLAIFDVSRGEWRDGVLSFMGYFGNDMMFFGQTLKSARWVYNLISPAIQEQLENNIYASGKSLFIGFVLWILNTVSPDYMKQSLNNLLEAAWKQNDELTQTLKTVGSQLDEKAKTSGAQVVYKGRNPIKEFPTLTDIQNFQSIVQQPEVFCSKEFQAALAPALQVAPLRLLIELLNIPTLSNKIIERCRGMSGNFKEDMEKTASSIVVGSKIPKAASTTAKLNASSDSSSSDLSSKKQDQAQEKQGINPIEPAAENIEVDPKGYDSSQVGIVRENPAKKGQYMMDWKFGETKRRIYGTSKEDVYSKLLYVIEQQEGATEAYGKATQEYEDTLKVAKEQKPLLQKKAKLTKELADLNTEKATLTAKISELEAKAASGKGTSKTRKVLSLGLSSNKGRLTSMKTRLEKVNTLIDQKTEELNLVNETLDGNEE